MIYRKNTKELLAESILDMAKRKPVDKITIKDITENCGMTAPTFYNHFSDKYDLIAWTYIYPVEKKVESYKNGDMTWNETMSEVLSFLRENHSFYKNALKNTSGQNSFMSTIQNYSTGIVSGMLEGQMGKKLEEEEKFQLRFYMNGWSGAVTEWLLDETRYTIEELTQYLSNVMPTLLKSFLL